MKVRAIRLFKLLVLLYLPVGFVSQFVGARQRETRRKCERMRSREISVAFYLSFFMRYAAPQLL